MTMTAMILKFTHLVAMLSSLGLLVFVYVHFVRSLIKQQFDPMVLRHLHRSFDTALSVCWFVLFVCGVLLIHPKGYHLNTPWIEAAFVFSVCVFLLWGASLLCKYRMLTALVNNQMKRVSVWSFYHVAHGLIALLVVVIARDAITKTTWLMLG